MVGQDLVDPSVPGNGHAASHCHGTGSPGWVSNHGGGSDAAVVGHLPRDPACSVQTSNPGAAREHDRGFLPSDTNAPRHGAAPGPRLRSHFLRLRRCCPRPKAAPSCSWCSHGPLQSQMLRAARAQPQGTAQKLQWFAMGGSWGKEAPWCRGEAGSPQPFHRRRLNQGRWRGFLLSVLFGFVSVLLFLPARNPKSSAGLERRCL